MTLEELEDENAQLRKQVEAYKSLFESMDLEFERLKELKEPIGEWGEFIDEFHNGLIDTFVDKLNELCMKSGYMLASGVDDQEGLLLVVEGVPEYTLSGTYEERHLVTKAELIAEVEQELMKVQSKLDMLKAN